MPHTELVTPVLKQKRIKERLFEVSIEEHLCKTIEIPAHTEEEAREKAKQMYRNSEIVLTSDDFTGTTLIKSETIDWEEI